MVELLIAAAPAEVVQGQRTGFAALLPSVGLIARVPAAPQVQTPFTMARERMLHDVR